MSNIRRWYKWVLQLATAFIVICAGCNSNHEIFSTDDVGKFCHEVNNSRINYDELIDRLQHVHMQIDTSDVATISVKVIAGDQVFEDKCWHTFVYDRKAKRVSCSGESCN